MADIQGAGSRSPRPSAKDRERRRWDRRAGLGPECRTLGNPTEREIEEMTIRVDPEEAEIGALFDFVDIDRRRVLEIGSGDGRLTWRYADRAAHVTAVEPFAPAVARAEDNLPPELARRVVLRRAGFREFAAETAASTFDVAIFSWSLCCMDHGDMVPALEEAHRLLRPNGTAIDIHPVPGTAEVEVHRAGQVVFAEPAATSNGEGEHHADDALAAVVARGFFVADRRAEFDFRVYASSVRELCGFLTEADAHARQEGNQTSDAYESELYGRVERMAAGATETKVAYHERGRITQLRPIVMTGRHS
jgi:SAM-dependent methyltransferase